MYVLAHRAGTVYLTRATTDGKMPEAITLRAEGLVADVPVPEADKKAVQIERLKAQLAKLEAAPAATQAAVHPTKAEAVLAGTVASPKPTQNPDKAAIAHAHTTQRAARKGRRAA